MKKFLIVFSSIILLIAVCAVFITANLRPITTPDNSQTDSQVAVDSSSVLIVESVRQLAKLETVCMTFQKQFPAERNQELWGLFGEQLLFDAYGQVIAGVDLSKLGINDIEIVDSYTVRIFMPSAEIFQVVLDNERSKVIYRLSGPFTYVDIQMEGQVRLEAQQNLLVCAHESGILFMAELNAQDYIRKLMHQLGFIAIEFPPR